MHAHLLVDTAVNTLIVSKALKVPSPGLQEKLDDPPSVEDESYDHKADVRQMHDLLRMVGKIVIFKKYVPL